MPNTLCHIGIQVPLNGMTLGKDRLAWVIIACIIPDMPWIVLKAIIPLGLIDPFDLRLYCTAQASLLLCLFCSAALACWTAQSVRIFLLLSGNCLLHLLLDAVEIKWGNGVHILAPSTWTMLHFDLVWPEHPVIIAFTLLGFVTLVYLWRNRLGSSFRPLVPTGNRAVLCILFSAVYLLGPVFFMEQLERVNTYNIHTLRMKEHRPGKPIAFDRVHYFSETRTLETFSGERIAVRGAQPDTSGRVSFRGRFLTPTSIASDSYRYHPDQRDLASLTGIFMACTLLFQSLILPHFQTRKKNRDHHDT